MENVDGTNFPETIPYSENGYVGTLVKDGEPRRVVASGEYIAADTKQLSFDTTYFTERTRIIKNEFEIDMTTGIPAGYEGELTRTYIGTPYKYGMGRTDNSPLLKEVIGYKKYENGQWVDTYDGASGLVYQFVYKDDEGYSNTLGSASKAPSGNFWVNGENNTIYKHLGDFTRGPLNVVMYDTPIIQDPSEYEVNPVEGDVSPVYKLNGYAEVEIITFLGGSGGAKWRYEGTVVKPEVDTRTYKYVQDYKGVVSPE